MKTLHLRRHSIKDGPNDTIGPKGLALAHLKGYAEGARQTYLDYLFHGPLVRTAQTGLAFLEGYYNGLPQDPGFTPNHVHAMPVVFGLGDADLFKKIATDEFKAAVKAGASNFQAVIEVHGELQALAWGNVGMDAVRQMFTAMKEDTIAVGFFHSPTIELACFATDGLMPNEYTKLADLEGLVFQQDQNGKISVVGKISVE